MGTITALLQAISEGSSEARDRLYQLVYSELKTIAKNQLRKHRSGILQTTALVNAAYERLAGKDPMDATDRRQFFFILSRAMHDVLVEQIRAERAQKRGGEARRVPLLEIAFDHTRSHVDALDLHEALAELGSVAPESAHVVLLRMYAGLTLEETAETRNETFSTTRRHWEYGKAWLHERLSRDHTSP